MAPRTAVLLRGSLVALAASTIALVVALVVSGDARLVVLAIAGLALVAAIPFGWFAFVRWLEDPRVRAVTSRRAIEVARCGDVHEIPLERVASVKAHTVGGVVSPSGPEDWESATGLEIESTEGRRFVMMSARTPELSAAILQAIAARARPGA